MKELVKVLQSIDQQLKGIRYELQISNQSKLAPSKKTKTPVYKGKPPDTPIKGRMPTKVGK